MRESTDRLFWEILAWSSRRFSTGFDECPGGGRRGASESSEAVELGLRMRIIQECSRLVMEKILMSLPFLRNSSRVRGCSCLAFKR